MTDNNVFEVSSGPLSAGEVWVSPWLDMQGFQSLATVVTGDELLEEARFEWSDDKLNTRMTLPWLEQINPISYGGAVSSSTPVLAKFVRVVVTNGFNDQGPSWKVLLALLQNAPTGVVAPLVSFPQDNDPGQLVKAVLFGRRPGVMTPQYTHILVDGNGMLQVVRPPNPTTNLSFEIVADTLEVELDFFEIFASERKGMTIFNDTAQGTLYLKQGDFVDLTTFDFKIPPQHHCSFSADWFMWGGAVWGIWDVADGSARVSEVI